MFSKIWFLEAITLPAPPLPGISCIIPITHNDWGEGMFRYRKDIARWDSKKKKNLVFSLIDMRSCLEPGFCYYLGAFCFPRHCCSATRWSWSQDLSFSPCCLVATDLVGYMGNAHLLTYRRAQVIFLHRINFIKNSNT